MSVKKTRRLTFNQLVKMSQNRPAWNVHLDRHGEIGRAAGVPIIEYDEKSDEVTVFDRSAFPTR